MKIIKLIIPTIIIVLLSACGSGSNNNGISGDGSDNNVKTGQFRDSPVAGLYYETKTQNGITDKSGTYQYKTDEEIAFYLGQMLLGTATALPVLYPTNIANATNALKIAQVLQSLNKNRDPDDGIDITNQFKEVSTAGTSIDEPATKIITTIAITPTMVSTNTAKNHLDKTMTNDKLSRSHTGEDFSFTSISNQDNIEKYITINVASENLEIKVPETYLYMTYLLAKNNHITSISANVLHNDWMANMSALIVELSHKNGIDYFSVDRHPRLRHCPGSYSICPKKVENGTYIGAQYLGKMTTCNSEDGIVYTFFKKDVAVPYIPDAASPLIVYAFYNTPELINYNSSSQISIALDRDKKRIVVKDGDNSGYFDISDPYFDDINTVSTRFFIGSWFAGSLVVLPVDLKIVLLNGKSVTKTFNTSAYRNKRSVVTTIDNVHLDGQLYDDFSGTTLDTNKWKIGQFSLTSRHQCQLDQK